MSDSDHLILYGSKKIFAGGNTRSSIDPTEFRQALGWLYSFVRPHRQQVVLIMLLSLFTTLLVLLKPYLTKVLIDDGPLARDRPTY